MFSFRLYERGHRKDRERAWPCFEMNVLAPDYATPHRKIRLLDSTVFFVATNRQWKIVHQLCLIDAEDKTFSPGLMIWQTTEITMSICYISCVTDAN